MKYKFAIILTFISFLNFNSYSQNKNLYIYQGGTNNIQNNNIVIGDTSHIDNNRNITAIFGYINGDTGIIVYPQKGYWLNPFVSYPSKFIPMRFIKRDSYKLLIAIDGDISFCNSNGNKNDTIPPITVNQICTTPCTKDYRYLIPIWDKDVSFIFGSETEHDKRYLYHNGKITLYKE